MSTTQPTLQPRDSAELLQVCANARLHPRADDERAWYEAKRDLVLCMERHRLLVAGDAGTPLCREGPQGRLLVAFTDDEAARAWLAVQHRAAPPCGFFQTSDTDPKSERAGSAMWLQWFEQLDAVAVVVNPAGPLGFVAHHYECRDMRPRLRRRRIERGEEAWLDVAARAVERARAQELMAELERAIDAGDQDRVEQLRPQIADMNRIGSGLWAAENEFYSGRWRLGRGELMKGAYQLVYGAAAWGRVADPYRSIDGLIEGGDVLLDLEREGVDDPDRPGTTRSYLAQLANGLAKMKVGYRDQDTAKFAEWSGDS